MSYRDLQSVPDVDLAQEECNSPAPKGCRAECIAQCERCGQFACEAHFELVLMPVGEGRYNVTPVAFRNLCHGCLMTRMLSRDHGRLIENVHRHAVASLDQYSLPVPAEIAA
jgi:hypothetical protein